MWFAKYYGRLVGVLEHGAYYSLIRYNELGMEVTEYVENSELEFLETEDDE
jgi:hypothetical protein